MPRRRRRSSIGLLLASIACGASAAAEPSVALELDPSPPGDGALLVASPDARGHGTLRARLQLSYASESLVLRGESQRAVPVVESELWAHAALSLAVAQRWLLYLDLPLRAASSGQTLVGLALDPPEGQAFGDVRVGNRFRVLGPAGEGTQLGAGVELWLPSGREAAYAGDGAFRGRGFVAVGATFPNFVWAVDAGYQRRKSQKLPGVLPTRVGSALTLGAAARVAFDPGARLLLGPELEAALGLGDGSSLFDPRSTRVHVLLGARYRPFGGALELGAGFGPDLGQAAGSAAYRAIASAGWSPEAPPPPPDRDGDSVPDATDICLNLAGVPSRDPMMHGCPDVPLDSDGDSVPDSFDACPRVPGEVTAERRTHGCPKPLDGDKDRIADQDDACPTEPGVASTDPKRHGCAPPPPTAVLTEQRITISQQIEFETGTSVLRAESDAILKEVLKVLVDHPEIARLEIQGHTDDRGTRDFNQRLSDDRAKSVAAWLIGHGVLPQRLVAKGYGQDRPLSENTTEPGRALNRRVEFRVLDGGVAPGGTP